MCTHGWGIVRRAGSCVLLTTAGSVGSHACGNTAAAAGPRKQIVTCWLGRGVWDVDATGTSNNQIR